MSWPETKVESFEDFVRHLRGVMPSTAGNQLYWFRGQKTVAGLLNLLWRGVYALWGFREMRR
jgi:hypothetical protein